MNFKNRFIEIILAKTSRQKSSEYGEQLHLQKKVKNKIEKYWSTFDKKI